MLKQKFNKERRKTAKITRRVMHTNMGMHQDCFLFSTRQRKPLPPKIEMNENHTRGSKTWHLLPGKYFQVQQVFNKHTLLSEWTMNVLIIKPDLSHATESLTHKPGWLEKVIPKEASTILFPKSTNLYHKAASHR